MVKLVISTTTDPASVGPASAFLSMPGWSPGPTIPDGISSFSNGDVRLLKHDHSIVAEDDLDRRWEEATGESVSEVVFLSRHTAVSNRPALTVHPIGVPHLREDETPPQGGRPGWAGKPNPRIGPWLRLLKKIAEEHRLVPEFEAWKLWDKQRAAEMIDPSILESCSIPQAIRCIQIGLLCVKDRANDRPNMHDVVLMLASAPLFTMEKSPVQTPFFYDG